MKTRPVFVVTTLLFATLILLGFFLARHKPLWNDEIYSQVAVVERVSIPVVLSGRFEEGNNCPLFYLLQKTICSVANYHSPSQWERGNDFWNFDRPQDRIVLRILPVLCTAFLICAVFYYFVTRYSWVTGLLSLYLALTSSMFWLYWAEARPYALWMCLTALQFLIFAEAARAKSLPSRLWRGLLAVNVLLSFTIVFAAAQIFFAVLFLILFVEKKISRALVLCALPMVLSVYYYALAPKFKFWLEFTLDQYIRGGIPRERLYVLAVYGVYLLFFFVQSRWPRLRLYKDKTLMEGGAILAFTLGMIATVAAVIGVFRLFASPPGTGFPVTNRYFVYLVPVGVISVTLLTRTLLISFRHKVWMQGIILAGVGYLLFCKILKIIGQIQGHYPQLFS